MKGGKLLEAVRNLRSTNRGPFRILCDNETFLASRAANDYYAKKNIVLLQIPPKSPDLNPIENYWSWVRKQMRSKDLADLRAGRPALGKTATKARLKALLQTKKAQLVAKNTFASLRKKCAEVIKKKGAAIRS